MSPRQRIILFICMILNVAALYPWVPLLFHQFATALAVTFDGYLVAHLCRWVGQTPRFPSIRITYGFATAFTLLALVVLPGHKVAVLSFIVGLWLTLRMTPWLHVVRPRLPQRISVTINDFQPPTAA